MSVALAPANNVAGALCAMGAVSCYSVNDVAIKFLSDGYALHQVMFLRSLIALTATLAVIFWLGGGMEMLRTRRPGLHAVRGIAIVLVNTLFFAAIAAMPLAEATALFFVSPLAIAALSFLVLGERVGPWRWLAVAIGLAGVVVMLRPGSGAIKLVALLPIASAIIYAGVSLLTRRMGSTEHGGTMAVYAHLAFMLIGLAVGLAVGDGRHAEQDDPSLAFLLRGWIWPRPDDLAIFALIGVASAGGAFLMGQSYRLGEAGLVAPFEYTILPMAVLWGFVVFGDLPDAVAWLGMGLIVAGGLVLIWRETRNARTPRPVSPGREAR